MAKRTEPEYVQIAREMLAIPANQEMPDGLVKNLRAVSMLCSRAKGGVPLCGRQIIAAIVAHWQGKL
jgi:hypothetical protein